MLPVGGFSSGGVAICYVLPVSWTTSRLLIIGEAKAAQVGRLLKVTHQVAAPDRGVV